MRNAPDCWLVMTLRSSATVKTAVNERNRRSGKNRAGQGVLAFETQPQSEEGRKLGQDERQKEQRNQNDRL